MSAVPDVDTAAFEAARPRLFGIAYRMLGSVAEAEDVLQDAWLRWQGADRAAVRDPVGFLVTVTTRLALNVASSARVRQEAYIGPWLPEPIDTTSDPTLGAERGEALELAVLALLERLTPAERAAYVLREAFDLPYGRVAETLEVGEANARQLVSRARRHLDGERRARVGEAERRRLLEAFVAAAQGGDLEALERLLAEDVVSVADGGGVVKAARKPILGRRRVAKALAGVVRKYWSGARIEVARANGQDGVLVTRDGERLAYVTIEAGPEGIARVLTVVHPGKLAHVVSQDGGPSGPPSDST